MLGSCHPYPLLSSIDDNERNDTNEIDYKGYYLCSKQQKDSQKRINADLIGSEIRKDTGSLGFLWIVDEARVWVYSFVSQKKKWGFVFLIASLDRGSSWGETYGSEGKASACNAGDLGSIPGLGRSSGEGNGNPLQYPCPENSMGGGAQ